MYQQLCGDLPYVLHNITSMAWPMMIVLQQHLQAIHHLLVNDSIDSDIKIPVLLMTCSVFIDDATQLCDVVSIHEAKLGRNIQQWPQERLSAAISCH
jgi:hypothetical protein